MKLTADQRLICERIINVFETGTSKGKYDAISIYHDGPHDIRQITYGRSQTTEYGNLGKLVAMYAEAGGLYSDEFKPYVKMVGTVALVDNDVFKDLLRSAGKEDPVMAATQDKFFDQIYFQPALKWADANGFTLPLSMLVLYDSFIHSGGILGWLRRRFSEMTPSRGGQEKVWIQQYVEARHTWLSTSPKADLRSSSYRTKDLLREIGKGNWDFSYLPILANGTPVDASAPPPKITVPAIPKPAADEPVPFIGHIAEEPEHAAAIAQPAVPSAAPPAADPAAAVVQPAADRSAALRQLGTSTGVSAAVDRLLAYRDKYRPTSNPRYWAVVNFDLHSAKPRLFVLDCVAGLVTSHLCAHGRGSEGPADDGYAEIFSNKDGSNCTSLGVYHCDVTYTGEHGKSLYLDGLEASNSAARARHIVMHGATYVSPEIIHATGRIGRSLGCPALEMGDVEKVIPKLMGGSLLIHWKT